MKVNGYEIKPCADLYGANLYGADLCRADLCRADLCRADLRGADLCGADLYGANLYGANLCRADLCRADLRGADLCGADLCGADLRGAYLRGANLDYTGLPTFHFNKDFAFAYSDRIQIGCRNHSILNWLLQFKRIGRIEGYSVEEIEMYGSWIKSVAKLKKISIK